MPACDMPRDRDALVRDCQKLAGDAYVLRSALSALVTALSAASATTEGGVLPGVNAAVAHARNVLRGKIL